MLQAQVQRARAAVPHRARDRAVCLVEVVHANRDCLPLGLHVPVICVGFHLLRTLVRGLAVLWNVFQQGVHPILERPLF